MAKLTYDDVKAIDARVLNVAGVTPPAGPPAASRLAEQEHNVQVTGTTPNFLDVRSFAIAAGEMFTTADNEGRQRVAVLGAGVLPMLDITNPEAIIGESIRISGRQFKLIGLLATKGATGFDDNDEQILIPFNTGRFRIFGTDRVSARCAARSSSTRAWPLRANEERSAICGFGASNGRALRVLVRTSHSPASPTARRIQYACLA